MTKNADTNGSCNSGVNCSFREAVNAANGTAGANTITFAAGVTGTIGLTSALPNINRDLTIQGPGSGSLELTRTAGVFRIFFLTNGTSSGPTVVISGMSITNGNATGAQFPATNGGGIFNDRGTLTVNNCIFSGNTADFGGAAIFNTGTLTLSNCVVNNNSAAQEGAIQNGGANLAVTSCTFSGNTTTSGSGLGGGLFTNTGVVTVRDSSFTSNHAILGGGIYSSIDAMLTVSNCTFNGNGASQGGAMVNSNRGTLTVRNCTITGNTASNSGGGVANLSDTNGFTPNATISNSTVSGNSAPVGGGLYNAASGGGNAFLKLDNTIVASTNAQAGANLVNVGLGTSITSEGFNLSSDNGGGFLTAQGDQINTDPKLGPLQNNGGPTQTLALLAGSPAQDKGKNFGVTTDQRGSPRPIDIPSISNAPGGDGSDIGAVEMDPSQSVFILTVTTTDDHNDGVCSISDCTLREAINAANAASGLNLITFANGVSGTISLQPGLGTLTVTDTVQIIGPGARVLAVSGNESIRVLNINSGATSISGLAIRDGWNAGSSGDGVSRQGGGIYNQATLSLTNCALDNNWVQGANNLSTGGNGGAGQGGAIYNNGSLSLSGCTFSASGPSSNPNGASGSSGQSNSGSVTHGGNGGAGQGGAIFNNTGANLTMLNCTFANNFAVGGNGGQDLSFAGGYGGDGSGGAVCNLGTASATSCTISANTGSGGTAGQGNNSFNDGLPGIGTGGLINVSGTTAIDDTICAANSGNHGGGIDVYGTFSSGGHNLIGSANHSAGFTGTDQVGTDGSPRNPLLQQLGNYGGDTNTFALFFTSTAIDAGDGSAPSRDQRGYSRSGVSDIGAFEFGGRLTPAIAVSRKNHSGTDFDVNLPFTGPTVGVECRRNTGADPSGPNAGHDHQVIVTFPFPVAIDSATGDHSVTADALPSGFNQTYTLNLHNVPNAQLITLTLNNVRDNTNSFTDTIPMGVLAGDTTGDGNVNSSDIAQTKSKSGQTVDASNFREDVTVDLALNSGDIALVKSKSGTALP